MVDDTVQIDQMNPLPLAVHLMYWRNGSATVDSVCRSGMSVMVHQIVQMEKMKPPQLVVHLPAPVIQTFVFHLDRRFYPEKTVETALIVLVGVVLVGAATMDSVWISGRSAMVHQTVQMDQMNPPPFVVHLPVPVIQTFVFMLDRRLNLDKTVETALIVGRVLVGAATVDSVCRSGRFVIIGPTVQMEKMNPPQLVVHLPAPVIQTFVFQLVKRFL